MNTRTAEIQSSFHIYCYSNCSVVDCGALFILDTYIFTLVPPLVCPENVVCFYDCFIYSSSDPVYFFMEANIIDSHQNDPSLI